MNMKPIGRVDAVEVINSSLKLVEDRIEQTQTDLKLDLPNTPCIRKSG